MTRFRRIIFAAASAISTVLFMLVLTFLIVDAGGDTSRELRVTVPDRSGYTTLGMFLGAGRVYCGVFDDHQGREEPLLSLGADYGYTMSLYCFAVIHEDYHMSREW